MDEHGVLDRPARRHRIAVRDCTPVSGEVTPRELQTNERSQFHQDEDRHENDGLEQEPFSPRQLAMF
jgi:hypothetical protein